MARAVSLRHHLQRLCRDERGQDLLEYALLTAGIAVVSAATWPTFAGVIGTAYSQLDANQQNLWEIPPPGGAP